MDEIVWETAMCQICACDITYDNLSTKLPNERYYCVDCDEPLYDDEFY